MSKITPKSSIKKSNLKNVLSLKPKRKSHIHSPHHKSPKQPSNLNDVQNTPSNNINKTRYCNKFICFYICSLKSSYFFYKPILQDILFSIPKSKKFPLGLRKIKRMKMIFLLNPRDLPQSTIWEAH